MAWLSGYSYRVKVPCSHTTAGAQTLYQMQLAIIRGAGSNSAGTIYLNSHALAWPDDIRFTAADGTTILDFYREENDATDGTWHVELNSISASGDTDFYCYYGKTSDTNASSGPNTFIFFDDFELHTYARWTAAQSSWGTTPQGTVKFNGSYAAKGLGSSNQSLYKTWSPAKTAPMLYRVRAYVSDTIHTPILICPRNDDNDYIGAVAFQTDGHFIYFNGAIWVNLPTDTTYAATTWYLVEVVLDISAAKYFWWINGAYKGTANMLDATGGAVTGLNRLEIDSCATASLYIDDLWVRNWANPEPAWATPGTEEIAAATTSLVVPAFRHRFNAIIVR